MTDTKAIGTKSVARLMGKWLLLLLVLGCLWLGGNVFYFLNSPASRTAATIVITISPGMSLDEVAGLLQCKGLVRSARKFSLLVRVKGLARSIKAGEYELSTGLRPGQLLDKLVQGSVMVHQVTFPEGVTVSQIARILESAGLARAEHVLAAANDRKIAEALGIPAASLEGYLFPDTYRFARDLPASRILQTMVARFKHYFGEAYEAKARKLGLTRHQVVILASIVEKETAVASERPLIAGVFLNRLKRGIPLQSDPTVIYGLPGFDGNLTRADLKADTPYNTYTRKGLPAGPICNPGAAALKAVLYPTATPYLYFVAKKDGTHYFSATLAEHNAAVARYQKRR
ncbi:MAG: endolytic transglycosylase MltG [Deltaproteobacteria bacterium]|nr:endolytic transglycosylase MltG [Deltaproteobacteria bacterium]MBW2071621.1 endolytic transglycosylase MltG [Deltaproteobacteria bacterium]